MSASNTPLDTLIHHYQTAIDAVCELAEAYYRLGKLDTALGVLQAGTLLLEQTLEQQMDESKAKLLLQQGKLLVTKGFHANSGYDAAVSALLQAQELATSAGNEDGVANALQLLGQAYYNKALIGGEGDYDKPLGCFQQALARREALEDRRGVAESVFYIGLIYERREQPGEAQSYYTKALAIAEEHGYAIEHSYAARHLAGLAQDAGDLEQALALFSQSLALREAAGYKILLPLSHLAVGDVFLAQRDLPQAIKQYRTAYALSQEMDTPVAQIFCLLSLGSIHQQERELPPARSYFEQAHTSAQEIAFPLGIREASKALVEIARLENIRETITASAEARGRNVHWPSEPPTYGDVWLRVEPLERGQGFEFVNALAEGVIPQEYIKPVEEGVREAMENGVLQGYPIIDLRVTLFDGSYHEVDSSARAFKKAGAIALKAAVEKANPIVLGLDND